MNSKVIAESGTTWIKFGTKHFIQWGKGNNYTKGEKTVTFPKPFSSVPSVTCGRVNTYSSATYGKAESIYSIPTTTNFQYFVHNEVEGGYFMWHAIGL